MNDHTNSITPYQFEGHNFSIVMIDGEPWFLAPDVARELGYAEGKDLTRSLDDDEKGRHTVPTPGGNQSVLVISEPGLYRAIIQRRANKKHDASLTARLGRFQRWVFHDVLPSIRKIGSYGASSSPTINVRDRSQLVSIAIQLIEVNKELETRAVMAEEMVAEQRPKVAAHDRIADSFGAVCRRIAAKNLGIPPLVLNRWMRTNGWTYQLTGSRDDLAYQSKMNAGLLEHKVETGDRPDGTSWTRTSVRVTPKGMLALAKAFPPSAKEVA